MRCLKSAFSLFSFSYNVFHLIKVFKKKNAIKGVFKSKSFLLGGSSCNITYIVHMHEKTWQEDKFIVWHVGLVYDAFVSTIVSGVSPERVEFQVEWRNWTFWTWLFSTLLQPRVSRVPKWRWARCNEANENVFYHFYLYASLHTCEMLDKSTGNQMDF